MPISHAKKYFFRRNLCYHTVDERNRLQEQQLGGIFTGPRGPKNHFVTEADKAAVKSRVSAP